MNPGNIIAGIGVGLTALVIMGASVGWVLKNYIRNLVAPIVERQTEMAADIAAIKHEVMPDSGPSMGARVVRIETLLEPKGPEK